MTAAAASAASASALPTTTIGATIGASPSEVRGAALRGAGFASSAAVDGASWRSSASSGRASLVAAAAARAAGSCSAGTGRSMHARCSYLARIHASLTACADEAMGTVRLGSGARAARSVLAARLPMAARAPAISTVHVSNEIERTLEI